MIAIFDREEQNMNYGYEYTRVMEVGDDWIGFNDDGDIETIRENFDGAMRELTFDAYDYENEDPTEWVDERVNWVAF